MGAEIADDDPEFHCRERQPGMAATGWPGHLSNDGQLLADSTSHSELAQVSWNNQRLIHGDIATEIQTLKQRQGREGWIDEYQLMVNPVALGRGGAIFEGCGAL